MLSLYTESFPEQSASIAFVEGFMGRFVSGTPLACIPLICFFLAGCGSSKPTNVVSNAVPASVTLSPSPDASLEAGKAQAFTATARNILNNVVTETFSFASSNPAVLTIATNGTACAGTWNSLTSPQVCTAGPTGVAQVTATAQGVASPPVTVYVHQHITNIIINKVAGQPSTLSSLCLSRGAPSGPESQVYEALAFSGNTDITSSVGPVTWQAVNSSFVKLGALATGTPLNQEVVSANLPGSTSFFASVSGINSQPVQFTTCPVQSILITPAASPGTSFVVNTGTATTLNATVTDSLGLTLTGIPLTWTSTNPVSISASGTTSTVYGSVGTASAVAAGGGTVIASCTPPSCNGGIRQPPNGNGTSLPIYPQDAVSFTVKSSAAPANPTVYASTTACSTSNPTGAACNATIIPVTRSSSTAAFAAGNPVVLPFSPNSILFDPGGTNAFLGVDSSGFGQKGVMIFSGTALSQSTVAAGKVLAVSPDGTLAVLSDTADSPNQVFIYSNSTHTAAAFLIPGATAAAFSPDGLKVYIVAGSRLYVYSKVDAFQTISLSGPANDVTFFPQGAFAYLAGGGAAPSAVTVRHTCDNTLADTVPNAAIPSMVRALPDAATVLALEPPFVQFINVTPPSPGAWVGCAPPVNDVIASTFNLGQGSFRPTQFIISADGSAAYILGQTQAPNPAPLPYIIAFSITNQTSSLISLAGNATPLSASLSPAGDLLFVGANDGALHVIDASSATDTQQVDFSFPQNALCFGPGNPVTQVPLSTVAITAASQSGASTTYTHSLTSGQALQAGQTIVISGMKDGSNNGTFAITALGSGNFTVSNSSGVSASSQSGTGTVAITCNPDLVAVKP